MEMASQLLMNPKASLAASRVVGKYLTGIETLFQIPLSFPLWAKEGNAHILATSRAPCWQLSSSILSLSISVFAACLFFPTAAP